MPERCAEPGERLPAVLLLEQPDELRQALTGVTLYPKLAVLIEILLNENQAQVGFVTQSPRWYARQVLEAKLSQVVPKPINQLEQHLMVR